MEHLIHFLWLISSAVAAIFSISDPITPVHCLVVYIRLMGQIYNFPCLIYFSTRRSRSVLLKGFFRIGALRLKPKKKRYFEALQKSSTCVSGTINTFLKKIIYKSLIIKKKQYLTFILYKKDCIIFISENNLGPIYLQTMLFETSL